MIRPFRSIQLELAPPIPIIHEFRLLVLFQHASLEDKNIHLGSHKATVAILYRANDRLASHIKARVYDNGATGLLAKRFDDLPVEGIVFAPHSLDARGIIHMSDRRDLRARDV